MVGARYWFEDPLQLDVEPPPGGGPGGKGKGKGGGQGGGNWTGGKGWGKGGGGGGGPALVYPQFVGTDFYGRNSIWTGARINVPGTPTSGNLLLVVSYAFNGELKTTAYSQLGYTKLGSGSSFTTGTRTRITVGYKEADGTEVDANMSSAWSETTTQQIQICWEISGWDTTTPPEIAFLENQANTDPHDHPGISPSFGGTKPYMLLGGIGWSVQEGAALDAYDASFTDNLEEQNNAGGSLEGWLASQELNEASFDPDAWSWDANPGQVVSVLIAVPGTGV